MQSLLLLFVILTSLFSILYICYFFATLTFMECFNSIKSLHTFSHDRIRNYPTNQRRFDRDYNDAHRATIPRRDDFSRASRLHNTNRPVNPRVRRGYTHTMHSEMRLQSHLNDRGWRYTRMHMIVGFNDFARCMRISLVRGGKLAGDENVVSENA